jgi:3-deoxy-D-manno-octulosonic-acid transferase
MYRLYNLLLRVSIVFILPWCLLNLIRGKYRVGLWQRMGFYPDEIQKGLLNQFTLWIHAVSVGEVIASVPLIKGLKENYPNLKIVLSTVTVTGNKIAKEKVSEADYIIYFPFDFLGSIKRALKAVNPSACIIMETELWPNFLKELNVKDIPTVIVNGRVSEKSYKGYNIIKPFMKEILKNISLFNMQTEGDAKKIITLGAKKRNVIITGNIKYDCNFKKIDDDDIKEIKDTLGINGKERILIAGSTHSGEEDTIVDVYSSLLKDHPDFRLIIAPRHIERAGEVEEIIKMRGLVPVRRTCLFKGDNTISLSACGYAQAGGRPVIILDTIGELSFIYSIGTIVFVGGSLIPHGGQNILEPLFYKKPVLFGKYMMNFHEISKDICSSGGGIQVNDKNDLRKEVAGLLDNEKRMAEVGEKGYQMIMRNRGALQKNLKLIGEMMSRRK